MGAVWLGQHTHLGHNAVIKSLHPQYAQNPHLRERFFLEARLLSQLNHPAIVRLYDFIIQGETPYLIMEYVQGETLEAYLTTHGLLSPEEAYALLKPIFEALAYLHSQKIIHRDLKPANILVLPEGGAKLIDFGIAKALEEDLKLTQTGMQVGTLLYMAPEQIQGHPVSPQTDLYAMGLIVYECLFGRFPWEWQGLTPYELYQRLLTEPPPLPQWTPEPWKAFFAKALAKNAAARYPSAQEMAEALAALSSDKKPPPAIALDKEREPHPAPSTPSLIGKYAPSPPVESRSPTPSRPATQHSSPEPAPSPAPTSLLLGRPFFLLALLIGIVGTIGALFLLLSAPGGEDTRAHPRKPKILDNPALSEEIRKALLRKLQNIARSSTDTIQWAELPTYKTYPLEGSLSVAFTRRFSKKDSAFEEVTEPCYLSGIPIGPPKGKRIIRIEYEVDLTCIQQDEATLTYQYDQRSHGFAAFDLRWPQESRPSCEEKSKVEVNREVGDCEGNP